MLGKRQLRLPFSLRPRARAAILPAMQPMRPRQQRVPDSPASEPPDPYRAWKQAGLLLLALAKPGSIGPLNVGLGLAGPVPRMLVDASKFGFACEMNQRSDFVVPRLAGEVYLPHPPLVPAVAALTQAALSPALEPFNAARVAAGIFLGAILLFSALATGEFAGPRSRWLPVLILIGSVGFWDRAHVLSGELGMTAGIAIGSTRRTT